MEVGIVKNDTWTQIWSLAAPLCNVWDVTQTNAPSGSDQQIHLAVKQLCLTCSLFWWNQPILPPSQNPLHLPFLCLFVWFFLLLLTSNSPVSSFPSYFLTCLSASFPFFFLPHCRLILAKNFHPVTLFIPCTRPSPPSSPLIYLFLLFFLLWLFSVFFIGFSSGLYLGSFVLLLTSLTQPFSASQIALTGKR